MNNSFKNIWKNLSTNQKKIVVGGLSASTILFLTANGISNRNKNAISFDNYNGLEYTVDANFLNVREYADIDSEKIQTLSYATKVKKIKEVDTYNDDNYEWIYVMYRNDKTKNVNYGWVAAVDYTEDLPCYYLTNGITENVEINSESAIVLEESTGNILYEKNAYIEMMPASITKVLTAYIVLKYGNLRDYIEYSNNAINVDGAIDEGYGISVTNYPLIGDIVQEGNKISVRDALEICLKKSENCTTVALQEYIEKVTNKKFTDLMNKEARNMGCTNCNFTNSFGYADDKHVVSSWEMATIMRYAMRNDKLLEIMGSNIYIMNYDERILAPESAIINQDREYYDDEAIACKTGYTDESGQTMVTLYEINGEKYIIVTMNGEGINSKYDDAWTLSNAIRNLNKEKEQNPKTKKLFFSN